MSRSLVILLAAAAVGIVSQVASAQEKSKKPDAAADEAAAVKFAKTHHPELAELLEGLKASDRPAYDKAIREISVTSTRITKLRKTDPERYELVARNWAVDSRIRLLAARRTMSGDMGRRDELKALLQERQQSKLALLRFDRDRAAERLRKLDAQIEDLERSADAAIERDLAKLDRAVKSSAQDRPPGKKKDESSSKKPRKKQSSDAR